MEINKEAFDWDREKIKQVLHELAQLPDFDSLPIPEEWGKLYDIPVTPMKTIDLKSFLKRHRQTREMAYVKQYEVREPAEGGLRTVPDIEPIHLILQEQKKILKDESGNEIVVPLLQNQDTSTESNNSTQQECQDDAPKDSSRVSRGDPHISDDESRIDE